MNVNLCFTLQEWHLGDFSALGVEKKAICKWKMFRSAFLI